jgi:hypothetical protein
MPQSLRDAGAAGGVSLHGLCREGAQRLKNLGDFVRSLNGRFIRYLFRLDPFLWLSNTFKGKNPLWKIFQDFLYLSHF